MNVAFSFSEFIDKILAGREFRLYCRPERGDAMGWVLLVHIGLPLVFGITFVFLRTASSPHAPTWDIAVDTALDLAILGIGATGAIFENAALEQAFPGHTVEVGIAVVAVDFLFTSLILLIRRYVFEISRHKFLWTVVSIDLGSLALLTTSGVLAYAYSVKA
jgi:hypothetical protein